MRILDDGAPVPFSPSSMVLIAFPYGGISTNPTMEALIAELVGRSCRIDLLSPSLTPSDMQMLQEFGGAVRHIPAGFDLDEPAGPRSLRTAARGLLRRPVQSPPALAPMGAYAAVIGVDPPGINLAERMNRGARRPLSYISFELLFEDEAETPYEKDLKRRERAAAQASSLVLIQDEGRRDAFCRENAVEADCCVLAPVAPRDLRPERNDYLRERLDIPRQTAIVLYQGSLYDWSCRHEFEELVSYWPDDVCLVVHSREAPRARMRRWMEGVGAGGRIRFSTESLPPAELATLTASADVGFASYRTSPDNWYTGLNLEYVGLSSGKISYYAMAGLPVLARHLKSIDDVISSGRFGRSFRRNADSAEAVREILEDRQAMGRAARQFYETRLDPAGRLPAYCDRLLSLQVGA